jgi:catechol 2,3-dioxygenase-like lactoylglutathione lyase family enzyme
MGFAIRALDHVNVTVPRALEAATKHFYGAILALPEIAKPEDSRGRGGAWYQVGAAQLHVSLEDPPPTGAAASRRHVCFVVADIAAASAACTAAGVAIEADDRPVRGWRRFYIRDPGGNRIEIACPESKA